MEMTEIKSLVEQVNNGLKNIQTEVHSVKEKDVLVEKKFNDLVKQVTDAGEELQKIQGRMKAIEVAATRIDAGKGSDEQKEQRKAEFRSFMRTGELNIDGVKVDRSGSGAGIEIRGMNTQNDPQGGYLVIPEVADFMVTRIFETSPMRQVCRVYQTGSNQLEVTIDDNEAGGGWQGEGSLQPATSTPDVGRVSIPVHKVAAEPAATVEMLQDGYVDVEAWLTEKASSRLARLENTAFVRGTGVNQPKGLLEYADFSGSPKVYTRNAVERVNLGSATDFTAQGLIDLQASLKEDYRAGAVFMTKRASYGKILALKGDDNFFFSSTMLRDGQLQLQLLGQPIVFADDMDAVAGSAEAIAYGNFGVGYTILDRVGTQILRDPFTSKGSVKFYVTRRVGGAVTNFEAIKVGVIAS